MPDRRTGEDSTEGREFSDYGAAGFGVGEVLGREAAKRQQEILTGAKYSANQAPPGYRPGFDPEYLYFGDPRYEDYAALLPAIYGGGFGAAPVQPPAAQPPVPVAPAVPDVGSLPIGSLENLTQADIDNAMGLISRGDYDIYSLADKLELDRNEAMGAYNRYLKDTYGMGTFNPEKDTLSPEDIQKYYGIADQQGFSPEQISRIFGIPLDQARSSLAQQYFSGIPVDQDYSTDEAQQVYDLYSSGRMGVAGISNYFGIPPDEVQSILDDIEGAEGIAANVGAAPSPTPAPTPTPIPTPVSEDIPSPMERLASAGIEVDGDYSESEADKVYDLYRSGQASPQDIASYFNLPLDDINTALADIEKRRGDGPRKLSSIGAQLARDDAIQMNPLEATLAHYNIGIALSEEEIKSALTYAQENGISYAEIDAMFDAPAGSAQDAAAALGMAASAGGIVGMADGGKFPDLSGDGEVTQEDILIGRGVIEKADGGILGLMKKEQKETPKGALLTETESYLEAQRILSNPDSSDRDKAFAKGTLETLKPQEQGGNMDMNAFAEMMQQLDKIQGATKGMQEGGFIGREQLDSLIQMTRDAILGDAENADEIIEEFISVFGNEAFQQLREKVLQGQVPDAQTEGMIEGQGGGMDDEIDGMIGNQQPVAVSPGEYIIPADVVASLGDGSSDAGAEKLDTMLDDVRIAKTGSTIQPGKIDDRVIPA